MESLSINPSDGSISNKSSKPSAASSGKLGPVATPAVIQRPTTEKPLPVLDMPEENSADGGQQGFVGVGGKGSPFSGRKKRLVLALGILDVVLCLALAGYVFAFYLPDQPTAVYNASLKRTGDAIDSLISYGKTQSQRNYKSYTISGSLNSKSFDATLNGESSASGDSKFTMSADIVGEKLDADVDTVHVNNSATPDIYLKVSGIKPFLSSYGLTNLDSLDGQWIDIDHTVIDSALAASNQATSTASKTTTYPSTAQLQDAATKAQAVNKEYLFSTASNTAVLRDEKYLGKATLNGRSTYHYQVGYNKAHLESYLDALGAALDSSSLNTWSKAANSGESVSQLLDISSIKSTVANANSSYNFNLWVDAQTKLPASLQFTDPSDRSSVFTLSQGYTGGTSYPFTFQFNGKDSSSGDQETDTLHIALNTSTGAYTGSYAGTEGSSTTTASFTVTPSTQTITVTPPSGAEPIVNVLAQLEAASGQTSL